MKTAEQWFAEYGVSHTHPTNKLIHFICVPLIVFSLLGMLWAIPMPDAVANISPWINAATIFMAVSWLFYLVTNLWLALGMALQVGIMIVGIAFIHKLIGYHNGILAGIMFGIFFVSWIFQFIGHKIEGAKPSFLKDIQFLLVGPMWILGYLYRKIGIKY